MEPITRTSQSDLWIATIFSAQAVAKGGIVRRNVGWVEREVGRDRFVGEVKARGFHLLECGGQFIIICHKSGMRLIC